MGRDPRPPQGGEPLHDPLGAVVQQHRQRGGVLDGHRRALPHVGRERVSRVSDEHDVAGPPADRRQLVDVVPQARTPGPQLLEDGRDVAPEAREQLRQPLRIAAARVLGPRPIQNQEHVELVAGQRHQANARARSPHLDGVLHPRVAAQQTPARVAGVGHGVRLVGPQRAAGRRPDAVGPHHQVHGLPAGREHRPGAFLQCLERRAEADREALGQHPVQVSPVDGEGRVRARVGEIHGHQRAAAAVGQLARRHGPPRGLQRIAQPQGPEHRHRVGLQRDPRSLSPKRRLALEHHRLVTPTPHCVSQREPPDPSAHNPDLHPASNPTRPARASSPAPA